MSTTDAYAVLMERLHLGREWKQGEPTFDVVRPVAVVQIVLLRIRRPLDARPSPLTDTEPLLSLLPGGSCE